MPCWSVIMSGICTELPVVWMFMVRCYVPSGKPPGFSTLERVRRISLRDYVDLFGLCV